MKISITSSMIMAATALSSSVFAAPFDSTGSTGSNNASVPITTRSTLDNAFGSTFKPMLDPFVGLIGLGDSSKVPLADAKKAAPGGPQTAIPEAAKKVANSLPADLPVSPPVGGREITFRSAEPEGAYERDSVPDLEVRESDDLASVVIAVPAVKAFLQQVLQSIGVTSETLTDEQKKVFAQLEVVVPVVVKKIMESSSASLPLSPNAALGPEDPSNKESRSLETEAFDSRDSLGASAISGLPIVGSKLGPIAETVPKPITSLPGSLLDTVSNNKPLTDVPAKLLTGVSDLVGKVVAAKPLS